MKPMGEGRRADEENISCPACGLTRRELYEIGRMGCGSCYETFEPEVRRALREMHGGEAHAGND